MANPDRDVAHRRDPRAATATITDGPPELLGSTEIYRPYLIDGRAIALPKVIPGIPEYMTVARAEVAADQLRPRLLENLDERNPEIAFQPDAALTFDFYAAAGTAISETIVGLEGFANHFISRHFDEAETFELGETTYTRSEVYNRALNERLSDFLPVIVEVERPTNEPWWPTFRRIQGLAALRRHSVFEPVKRRGLDGEKALIQRLLDREYAGGARMMLRAFEFFSPSWISPERAAALPEPPS